MLRKNESTAARAYVFATSNFTMESPVPKLKIRMADVQYRFKEFDAEHKFMMSFIAQEDKTMRRL